jgi:hypothetical protein
MPFLRAICYCAFILVNLENCIVTSVSYTALQRESKIVATTFFDSQVQSPYSVLYYLNKDGLKQKSFDGLEICGSPQFGLTVDIRRVSTNPTLQEIKEITTDKKWYTIRPFESHNSRKYSATWSTTCMTARWLPTEGLVFTPHFEQVSKDYRRVNGFSLINFVWWCFFTGHHGS